MQHIIKDAESKVNLGMGAQRTEKIKITTEMAQDLDFSKETH